jgi:hypothetical protein
MQRLASGSSGSSEDETPFPEFLPYKPAKYHGYVPTVASNVNKVKRIGPFRTDEDDDVAGRGQEVRAAYLKTERSLTQNLGRMHVARYACCSGLEATEACNELISSRIIDILQEVHSDIHLTYEHRFLDDKFIFSLNQGRQPQRFAAMVILPPGTLVESLFEPLMAKTDEKKSITTTKSQSP